VMSSAVCCRPAELRTLLANVPYHADTSAFQCKCNAGEQRRVCCPFTGAWLSYSHWHGNQTDHQPICKTVKTVGGIVGFIPQCEHLRSLVPHTTQDWHRSRLLPPCCASLLKHCMRSSYQTFIWKHALVAFCPVPSPYGCRWTVNLQ